MKVLALALLLIVLLSHGPLSLAQEKPQQSEWAAIQAVPAGGDLVIETKTGETIKGKLDTITDTTLNLKSKNKIVPFELTDIKRAYRVVGRSRGKSTLLAAGVGGATGVGVGLGIYLPARNDIVGVIVPAFGVIGTGVGAAIGALTGGGRKRVLIYESR